jgi:septum formation protein
MTTASYPKIYLASRSPRRRELLQQIGAPYEMLLLREHLARGVDLDESVHPGESPDDYVRRICEAKAEAGWRRVVERRLRQKPVLADDTTVCVDAQILAKPADRADAARMLGLLSGREHRVLTAVALQSESKRLIAVSESVVQFRELTGDEIAEYVETGEPTGKAGAYAIQGRAAAFISTLRGSYTGVMGLPLYETAQLLGRIGTP